MENPAPPGAYSGYVSFFTWSGIALGEAYATDNDFLGYFGANAIDQFAPAFKLSGEIIAPNALAYDVYCAITDNSAANFNEVNQQINGQRFGRLHKPQRGFGIFDYIIAGRLMWKPFDDVGRRAYLEPYALYSHDGEQKIEFIGDARQNLVTVGLAGEFEYGKFEFGFDTAINRGRQRVYGWDRNVIKNENRDGHEVSAFSEVITEKPKVKQKAQRALVTKTNKATVVAGPRDQIHNGKRIPRLRDHDEKPVKEILYNDFNRFTNAYHNDLRGAMFVCDMAYNFPCAIKLAAMAGIATGGDDPNKDLQSHGESNMHDTFRGFIGEQEIYSGNRVRSIFVMSGQGKIPRYLSIPAVDIIENEPTIVERFTNLILAGASFQAKPQLWSTTYSIQSNILAFWVDHRPRLFTLREGGKEVIVKERDLEAPFVKYRGRLDRFLGIEINFIFEAEIIKDLTFVFNGAVFLPGGFIKGLKGEKGITKEQKEFLKNQASPNEGAKVTKVPHIGDDPGYYFTFAFQYDF